ncbi:MAG: baseplate J/gp47 family protein [archaeon]
MDFREKTINDLRQSGVSVTPNNIVDDLFIKKYLQLNESLKEKIDNFPYKLSFKEFTKLNEEDMKKFAGNYFVETAEGEKATGEVRLFFDTPTDSFVAEGTTFSTEDGLKFFATEDDEITSEDMSNNSSGMYYYQSIEVEAEDEGEDYNVDPGEIDDCSNSVIMSRVVRIENPYKFDSGANPETPEQLYNRVQDSISVRNLANSPAISSILKNNFQTSLMEIFTVRTGDELMERDIVEIDNEEFRVGNKFDIWIETSNLTEYTAHIDKDEDPEVNFGYSIDDLKDDLNENRDFDYTCEDILTEEPLDKVISMITEVNAVDSSGEIVEEIEDVEFVQKEGHENSVLQQSYLDFTDTDYEDTVSEIQVKFLSSTSVNEIQRFVNDEDNRLPVGDPLVKHFEILPLYGTMYYKGSVEEIDMQEAITDFIKNYHYNPDRADEEFQEGDPLRRIIEISDIVGKMIEEGAEKVKLSSLELEIDLPDGTTETIDDEYKILPYQMVLPQITVARE